MTNKSKTSKYKYTTLNCRNQGINVGITAKYRLARRSFSTGGGKGIFTAETQERREPLVDDSTR
jgi:hypothetical protein